MRRIQPPPPTLVDAGRVRFGTYDAAIPDVNLIDARPWTLPVPRLLRALRLKEWQAFQFGNPRYFVAVALFNAKVLALAQVKVYDRELRRKHVFEHKLPGWAFQAPRTLLDSRMRWSGRGATLDFVNRLAQDWIRIDLDIPAAGDRPGVSGSITAHAAGCQAQVVSIPFAANRGMYSHKACLAPVGELRLGDELIRFTRADSYLLMDDHKGYYPAVMRWDWVTGGGVDAQGRRIGFNLTRNDSIAPERYNENCLWIDGQVHLLPPVTFVRRDDQSPEVWQVRDDAGEVEVDFIVELDGRVRVNALVMESRYRGPFGQVRGRLRGGGEVVDVGGMFGMGEDFYLRC
jgi:hypothetical protein